METTGKQTHAANGAKPLAKEVVMEAMTEELGTTAAGRFDSWAAYTHLKRGSGRYEIRHPRRPFSSEFSVWRWSDRAGYVLQRSYETLEEAISSIGG